jgi:hypothetical protein
MKALLAQALVALGVGASLSGCGAKDASGATEAAERFYAAAAAGDGAAACEQLSEDGRDQLERDERQPCAEAVLSLRLSGERAVHTAAYLNEAQVELDGGDRAFLEETPDGWRVTAAGCRPAPGRETPYDCEVES